jgi:phosphoribosylanthranilate isomerase
MIPRVKVCCIGTIEEAKTAIAYGASAVGLVGKMPSGPGVISDERIREIAKIIPPPIASFLLTSETTADAIVRHHAQAQTTTIQIVDAVETETYASVRRALPAVKLVQVIHVIDESSVDDAVRLSDHVDALLLDSGNPALAIKELGGTGRVHNWALSRRIVAGSRVPVFLAGGLTADNVREAIDTVQPFAVDLCSGVRTDRRLDERKLERFMTAVMR